MKKHKLQISLKNSSERSVVHMERAEVPRTSLPNKAPFKLKNCRDRYKLDIGQRQFEWKIWKSAILFARSEG